MCSNNLLITLHLVKENREQTYNLIEIVPEVYHKIFGYLDNESLHNASLVCQSWYKLIGSSSSLMKKFQVKIKLKNIEDSHKVCEVIKNSKRKIFHLEISYQGDFYGRIQEYWDIERGVFPCPLVEYLQENSFVLKNLLSLSILTTEVSEITNILKSCVNLQHLELKAMRWQEPDWLEITETPIFKLKTLTITSDSVTASCHQGLDKFLSTQIERLESLTFNRGVLDTKAILTIMNMKRLKFWEINYAVCGNIEKSGNLASLEEMKAFVEQNILENSSFLRSIPNLRKLSIQHLNQRAIELIGIHLKNLKELHTKSIDFNDISNPDLFANLELVKIEEFVDFFLQETILQQVADGATKFTQCLYDEICKPPHINWV